MKKNLEKVMRAKRVYETIEFERGKDPKKAMKIGYFRDKDGNPLEVGDQVFVYGDLEEDDLPDLQGRIDSFHDEYVTVMNKDGFGFRVDYDKLKLTESVNFERGKDPKRAMGIGHLRPYPQMSVEEFSDWFEEEIYPYYNTVAYDDDFDDFDFDGFISDLVNDWEDLSDDEFRAAWPNAPEELVEKMIFMRPYFLDFEYIKNLGY